MSQGAANTGLADDKFRSIVAAEDEVTPSDSCCEPTRFGFPPDPSSRQNRRRIQMLLANVH